MTSTCSRSLRSPAPRRLPAAFLGCAAAVGRIRNDVGDAAVWGISPVGVSVVVICQRVICPIAAVGTLWDFTKRG